ncbi:helix-turn-helix domain-containing protein [Streptococcus parauberis]|uniref:helix-turn-helix domain-containing protein n=1 Tax=Streptococcus parauberis TaxID=1348 RepID=UPI0037A74821
MEKYEINLEKLGNKIYNVRTNLGYSMEEFANRVGVSNGAINRYEKGRMLPRNKVLINIVKLSENPNQSVNTFIYGLPNEYLGEIFKTLIEKLKYSVEENEELNELINSVSEKLNNGELRYGDEAKIVEQLYVENIENSTYLDLKVMPEYILLRKLYNLAPIKYKIEEDTFFRTNVLPELDKYLISKGQYKKSNMELITLLASSIQDYEIKKDLNLTKNELNENIIEKFISIYNFDGMNKEEIEKIKLNIETASQSLLIFLLELEETFGVPVEAIKTFNKIKLGDL